MLDPPLSDVDFKNKMAWVWTALRMKILKIPGFNLYIGVSKLDNLVNRNRKTFVPSNNTVTIVKYKSNRNEIYYVIPQLRYTSITSYFNYVIPQLRHIQSQTTVIFKTGQTILQIIEFCLKFVPNSNLSRGFWHHVWISNETSSNPRLICYHTSQNQY